MTITSLTLNHSSSSEMLHEMNELNQQIKSFDFSVVTKAVSDISNDVKNYHIAQKNKWGPYLTEKALTLSAVAVAAAALIVFGVIAFGSPISMPALTTLSHFLEISTLSLSLFALISHLYKKQIKNETSKELDLQLKTHADLKKLNDLKEKSDVLLKKSDEYTSNENQEFLKSLLELSQNSIQLGGKIGKLNSLVMEAKHQLMKTNFI